MASRIEDYGMIGNLRTIALISNTGSLDWFCAPRLIPTLASRLW
jgi:hypothetical protein